MLSRYTTDEMAAIWSDEARYARWRDVEIAVVRARVACGMTSSEVLDAITRVPAPTAAQVSEIEAEVRHDVVAFLYAWTDQMDPAVAAHIHHGLTSSDIVDTALAIALGDASDLILNQARQLVVSLADTALEHRDTLCVARTHGQAAAFDVVGHRFADFAFAIDRGVTRLRTTRERLMVANLSGPVGTGVGLPIDLVSHAAQMLGVSLPEVTTQVVFRDTIATWVADLALLAAVCEAVATDIRIGQHDGVAEVAELRGHAQEGSSALPHKRNPISAENVTGLARLVRGYIHPALESVPLWQHRDISHSSVERVAVPDAAALTEHALRTTTRLVQGLHFDREQLQDNIRRAGPRLASSRLMIEQLQQGTPRREAAEQVRTAIDYGNYPAMAIEKASAEVLASEVLQRTFELVTNLRTRNTPPAR